jgi:hypothetical protein
MAFVFEPAEVTFQIQLFVPEIEQAVFDSSDVVPEGHAATRFPSRIV